MASASLLRTQLLNTRTYKNNSALGVLLFSLTHTRYTRTCFSNYSLTCLYLIYLYVTQSSPVDVHLLLVVSYILVCRPVYNLRPLLHLFSEFTSPSLSASFFAVANCSERLSYGDACMAVRAFRSHYSSGVTRVDVTRGGN